ncbi:hypothetical protein CC86DRAFT_406206 [Ophiobolus disseminans]|uniref:Uncharacterized protein n=1 Tax=Ophiobolus disseminans TaxID=1469910 RepID=A0A6A7A2F0_9PLEO|nr:hypothetical protein CC86DRAFT_406206 [Ophiobolus disseminans]
MSLLDLPTELRFQVYSYISVPLEAPFANYHGLYLSCNQVKEDINSEGSRLFRTYLASVKRQLKNASFAKPYAFLAMHHVHLIKGTHPLKRVVPHRDLKPMLGLHLVSLTVSLRKENKYSDYTSNFDQQLDYLFYLQDASRQDFESNTVQVVIELPTVSKRLATKWMKKANGFNKK